jgi:hypothetical protein
MQRFCRLDDVRSLRRLQTGFGEEVLAIEQQFRRGLAGHAIGASAPMRGAPAGGVEIGRIQPSMSITSSSGISTPFSANSPIQGRSTAMMS